MRAIYFIEIDGKRLYKIDSFWSKSDSITDAKIHDDSKNDQDRFFKSLCYSLEPYNEEKVWNDTDYEKLKRYNGAIYGYQKLIGSKGVFCPDKDDELSDPIYLKVINSVSKTGEVDSIDYKVISRDIKIEEILKNK